MSTHIDPEPHHDDIMYPQVLPFLLVYVRCLAAIWSGVSSQAIAICVVLYWLRMFAITAGYHRYFSHRAYATSRVFQFILAFLAQSSAQKKRAVVGRETSTSPPSFGYRARRCIRPFTRASCTVISGWIFYRQHDATDLTKVADFAAYPELRWLHRFGGLPGGRGRRSVLSPRWLAGPSGRFLLEHRAALSCHVLHQLPRACSRTQAVCDGRWLPQQLAAGSFDDG